VTASALAMDKVQSKRLFDHAGIPSPDWRLIVDETPPDDLGWPLVVKPSREGSTVGVTIVQDPAGYPAAVGLARRCHGVPLVERFIPGHEASVAVLDGEVLGTVEIRPKKGFYDYAAKYVTGDTEYLVPPPFPAAAAEDACRRAYLALGCAGHARVDVRVHDDGRPFVLEVNTLPGMTGTSLLPKIAAQRSMDYGTLVERILGSAGLRAVV
jgi:D-alanine-D-alanine ligase